MQKSLQFLKGHAARLTMYLTAVFAAIMCGDVAGAFAAADPTTGIDYKTDVADPIIASAKPAIIAGLAVLVLVLAVTLGKRVWHKASGN